MKTTSEEHPENGRGWQLVGLFGAILMMANLLITNAVEILAFLDFSELNEQESLFWLLFNLTRVLFTTEIITWEVFIFGFSMAGIIGGSLPRWISYLGSLRSFLPLCRRIRGQYFPGWMGRYNY